MSASSHSGRGRGAASAAPAVVVLGLLLSGCSQVAAESAAVYQPAEVTEVDGRDVKQVTLTAEGADRVDLQTMTAQRRGRYTDVPYAALIYDGQGVAWVYTVTAPLTFLRTRVEVDRIDEDRALLSAGPPPGTEVVTVGASEVFGAELGIGDSH